MLGYAHAHLAAGRVMLGTARTRRAPDPMDRLALGGGASRLAVVLTGTKLVSRGGKVKSQWAGNGNSLITGRTAQKWPPERRKGRGSRLVANRPASPAESNVGPLRHLLAFVVGAVKNRIHGGRRHLEEVVATLCEKF